MKMKKLKKLVAGILSAAMVMSTMAVTAFAAGPDTIDTNEKGNLTIHKYTEGNVPGSEGTGTTADAANLPDGAQPLAGAGFTIYKVADVNDLKEYYSTNPEDLPSVDAYVENNKIKEGVAKWTSQQKITGADGLATFSNLELGLYVVIETKTPDLVTNPMDPFILSVPMTTVDGDSWLYDIHVYPKNGTTTGEISLEKIGEDGAKLAGVSFKLEKKTGENTWTEIIKKSGPAGDNTGDPLNLVTGDNGKITVSGLSQGTYRFTEVSLGDAPENGGYILDKNSTYVFTVEDDGTITIPGGTGTEIDVQNEKPDMTKQVEERTDRDDDGQKWEQEADYNVGDTIPYKITVDVPANITYLKTFELTDTPTNLTDNVESIEIKCENNPISEEAYEAVKEGTDGFKITFYPGKMADYANKELVITYTALLKDTADTSTVGNPNTASLKYSNEINVGSTPGNPTGDPGEAEIKDNAVVYTFKLNVHKTGENSTPLEGVKFDLYKEVAEGTSGAEVGNSDNGLDTNKYWLKIATDLTTDRSGNISKSGLANGTYYLVETDTNSGYNLLDKPLEVVLDIQYVTSMTENWTWNKVGDVWTLVKHEITSSRTTFDGKTNAEEVYSENVINVINKKGFTLPVTGGMGTLLASFAGILLMAGGAFVFLSSRKGKNA